MLPTITALLLTAAAPQLKLAVLDVNLVGFGAESRSFYTQHVGTQLTEAGAEATTSQQIAAVLGLERQKALLGCSEQSSECLVELANALGVDGIAMFDVAKVGSVFQLSARVIDAARGQAVATFSRRVGREEDLLDAVSEGAHALARDAAPALSRSLRARAKVSSGAARKLSWIPAVGGLAFAGLGTGLLLQANANHLALTSPEAPLIDSATGRRLRDEGALLQSLGALSVAVGGAALVAAGAMALFGGAAEAAPQVSVAPVTGGAALMVVGALP